jgi:hypothetical protein
MATKDILMNEDLMGYMYKIAGKVMREMEDEAIRDCDGSRLNGKHICMMIRCISRAESELDVLLTLTEEIGGFGSSYPKKCLESLKLMRTILEMELNAKEK